jgi:hypothetical protein
VLAQQRPLQRAQQREGLDVDDDRLEARQPQSFDLLRQQVEAGGGDDDLELAAFVTSSGLSSTKKSSSTSSIGKGM